MRIALACAIAVTAAAASAAADGGAPSIAAVAASDDDVRSSILVGPSGQVWEPDGKGVWIRRAAGGVAADVRGATRAGPHLLVAGKATPFYRRDNDRWFAMRLGERGRTTIGRGPRASLAIGRLVFVWNGTGWKRVGAAPGTVGGLWAASETKVVVATDAGLARLIGGAFRPVVPPAGTAQFVALDGGVSAWAVTADGAAFDVNARRVHRPTVGGQPMNVTLVTAAGDSTWALGATPAGPALARMRKGAWSDAVAPPLAPDDPPLALVADKTGALLVVTANAAVHLMSADGIWTAGTLTQSLPTPTTGPGPARAP